MPTQNPTLTILLARFNGRVLIPFSSATECLGIAPQTGRNQLSKGSFPIPTLISGNRRYIHISDMAAWVESLREQPLAKREKCNG